MALNVGELFATFTLDDKPFTQTLKGGEKKAEEGGKRSGGLFAKAYAGPLRGVGEAAVGLFAADKVVDFFKQSNEEARESQKVSAQTASAIKATGGAANVSAKEIGNYATAVSNKTGIDDEQIQSSENMLLTFKNIRNESGKNNDIFKQSTQVLTDMSAATGQDATSAAIQLGKALNDPTKGISALSRVGVTFTAQQAKQIKAMQASGNTMGAQKIILKELNSEFGGSAEAQATAGEKMSVTWKNIQEQIGTALLPAIDSVENFLSNKLLPAFSNFITWLVAHWPQIQAIIVRTTAPVVALFEQVGKVIYDNRSTFEALGRVLIKIAPYVLAIGAAVVIMTNPWLLAVVAIIAVVAAFGRIKDAGRTVVNFFSKTIPNAVKTGLSWLRNHWQTVVQIVLAPFLLLPVLIWRYWGQINHTVQRGTDDVVGFFTRLPGRITRGLASLGGAIASPFIAAYRWADRRITGGIDNIVGFFSRLPGRITRGVGNVGHTLWDKGKSLISGMLSGITAGLSDIGSWLRKHLLDPIVNAVKHLFGIHSPSTVMKDLGSHTMNGFIKGMLLHDPASVAKKLVKDIPGLVSAAANRIGGLGTVAVEGSGSYGGNSSKGSLQAAAQAMLAKYGWGQDQWSYFNALEEGEAGWNPNAQNPTSTAYGLGQFLDSTWASVGMSKTSNPLKQLDGMMKYIKQSYGSPEIARISWLQRSPHWYDNGGMLMPGTSLVHNNTGMPERVTAPHQEKGMRVSGSMAIVDDGKGGLKAIIKDMILDQAAFDASVARMGA